MNRPAKWLQIIVSATAGNTEAISEQLESMGALSITLRDAADEALFEIEPHTESHWQQTQIIGLFEHDRGADALSRAFTERCGEPAPGFIIETLPDEAWERRCLEYVKPMRFGKNLWIYPSWSEQTPAAGTRVIRLDPGLAFGTGTHPTTALCLEWIDSAEFSNKSVLDYGCGSGILAIAAIQCGASHVDAVDHDEQALTATLDNAEKNHCRNQIDVYLPDQLSIDPADIIFANILAGPLINLAQTLAALCSGNGNLILSGLLPEQHESIHAAYSPWFELTPPREKDGWLLIECKKR